MLRFLELIVRFREYVILAALIVMSIALMSLGNAGKLAGFRTFIVGGIGLLQSTIAWLPNPLTIASENAALRQINYTLNQEVVQSRRALVENQRLKHLLALRDTSAVPLITAKVVGLMRDKARYYLTLNVGASDSVQTGMAVLDYNGLIGSVQFTSNHYCIVQTILDKNTRLSVLLQNSATNGILSWENSEKFWLKNIAKTNTVNVGEIVLTSPFSTRFAPYIPIGRVVSVSEEPNTLFQRIEVEPLVQFAALEYVFVSKQQPDPERLMIEELLEKRMKKKQ